MRELLETYDAWRAEGLAVGRAVVVRTFGSAPRAEGAVLLETSTDAFVVRDGCFTTIGGRLANEHHVIATGQQPPVFIKGDLDVTQSESGFRQIDRDALPPGDRPGGPVRQLLCRRHGLALRHDIVGKRRQ